MRQVLKNGDALDQLFPRRLLLIFHPVDDSNVSIAFEDAEACPLLGLDRLLVPFIFLIPEGK